MQKAVPTLGPTFKKALDAGLRMPLGTDAVAGAHGQNAREAIARVVDGGQKPMDAIIGATSLAAESLNLGTTIGSLKTGYEADIVAVAGDPVQDIHALRSVSFVMKGGRVFKAPARAAQ
jgi:imidazolonepropionase-like amidohydrolase